MREITEPDYLYKEYFYRTATNDTMRKDLRELVNQVLEISKSIGEDVILGLNSSYLILNSKNVVRQFKGCKNFFTLIFE